MKKPLIIIGILLVVGGMVWADRARGLKENAVVQSPAVVPQTTVMTIDVDRQVAYFDVKEFIGQSALEATRQVTQNKIEIKGSKDSAFVVALNGRKADNVKKEYWALYVNGKLAQVGAGSYNIKEGDSIEWKINTY